MIHDLLLRCVVTALFATSAAECVYGIAAGRLSRAGIVGNALHALMAVAMVVMAWPRGAGLPTAAPMLFFLLAAVWFAAVALGRAEHRRAGVYRASMMLAMVWMYATSDGPPAPADVAGHHGAAHGTTGAPPFVTGLTWLFAIGFAVAGAWWSWRLVVRRRAEPVPSRRVQAGIAAQAMMAAGTAVMFAVLL